MALNALTAISPIDGRYWTQTNSLSEYFSEFSLIKYRVRVEVEYFIALCELKLPQLSSFKTEDFDKLRNIYISFKEEDALEIKKQERITNHDVKALEYFLKGKFDENGWQAYKEFIHFALTSQDINNTAIPLSLKEVMKNVYLPYLENELLKTLKGLASKWKDVPMLARTHGQPATPTVVGKEILVFVERLENQIQLLHSIPFAAKFGGATGNFNAHKVAYPQVDWLSAADNFIASLGLKRLKYTTQIEHYDYLAALLDNLKRINTILIDFSRDMWAYISLDYFKQHVEKNEVGSSTMPHKVNPIDFENAEGNLGIANALYDHMSQKLPISRLQRDLTDSTVLRNLGVPFAHSLVSFKSLIRGLSKLNINQEKINADLDDNWAIVSEAIQTVLRREGYEQPYEALKALTRVEGKITHKTITDFVDSLKIHDGVKTELKSITPFNYVGIFPQ